MVRPVALAGRARSGALRPGVSAPVLPFDLWLRGRIVSRGRALLRGLLVLAVLPGPFAGRPGGRDLGGAGARVNGEVATPSRTPRTSRRPRHLRSWARSPLRPGARTESAPHTAGRSRCGTAHPRGRGNGPPPTRPRGTPRTARSGESSGRSRP